MAQNSHIYLGIKSDGQNLVRNNISNESSSNCLVDNLQALIILICLGYEIIMFLKISDFFYLFKLSLCQSDGLDDYFLRLSESLLWTFIALSSIQEKPGSTFKKAREVFITNSLKDDGKVWLCARPCASLSFSRTHNTIQRHSTALFNHMAYSVTTT
ncbi:hypothetical protein ILYODFUR_007120 [Ilyodon furcidens]|uniref:Uncharacterized protein n=1 Tax=Ilyodon furcidens TaxID=33524 RepID=A0ABV0TSM7_9TELE